MALSLALLIALSARFAYAAELYTTVPQPGQPSKSGTPGQFEIVGDSLVSAQQIFLGNSGNKVYIIDKTENNPAKVAGHPAWASEYTIGNNSARLMDVYSNTFCAGGASLGDGRWINVGGNQGVTWGGLTPPGSDKAPVPYYGGNPYQDYDGGKAVRFLTPCDDDSCEWVDDPNDYMTSRRWYPTIETLEEGNVIIIGGDKWGGYVNSADQNNPTYEFYPKKNNGDPLYLPILDETLPANLFPLTWLLPSGKLFIQTNYAAELFDYRKDTETRLDDIPHAVRTYPASGAVAMLPLTPANNYSATILFCGGSNLTSDQWTTDWNISAYPADRSCVTIRPDDAKPKWKEDATLPEGRTMGNFIFLPDGKLFLVNGGALGTAGYGNESWAIGHSYATSPNLTPLVYDPDPSVPAANKFTRANLGPSTIPRLYHSTALLLPDGSVFVAGSNPNPDYTVGPNVQYPTESRTERFYPSYYSSRRPDPQGLVKSIPYGGAYFNVTLTSEDLAGDPAGNADKIKAVIIRTGFSTHGVNFNQRFVELATSHTLNADNSLVLHVSPLPPNPAILAPGPAILHIVVNGVPSVGVAVMIGNGKIGKQPTSAAVQLPPTTTVTPPTPSASNGGSGGSGVKTGGAARAQATGLGGLVAASMVLVGTCLTMIL